MAIYIDSAQLAEIETAVSSGWISGITTNPLLLAAASGNAQEHLALLAAFPVGEIFYQVQARTARAMLDEAQLARQLLGEKLVVKIPPTAAGFRFAAGDNPWKTCITAVFSPTQALAAREAGADYLAVYYSRMAREEAAQALQSMHVLLSGSSTTILAASLKSNEDVTAAMLAGAHHCTLPPEILAGLLHHPLSDKAVDAFQSGGLFLS